MADFRPMIADQLRNGARWARSFQRVKAHLDRMVDDGHVERVRPLGGNARNMVALTEAGRKRWLMPNMKRTIARVQTEANDA